jgi:hypothetical protein
VDAISGIEMINEAIDALENAYASEGGWATGGYWVATGGYGWLLVATGDYGCLRVATGVLKNLVKISERVYVMMSAKKSPLPGPECLIWTPDCQASPVMPRDWRNGGTLQVSCGAERGSLTVLKRLIAGGVLIENESQ